MIKSNNNLGYINPGILQVEDFQNIKEYSSYMMPNNIVLASYQMNVFKDYRNYSGYSYELYYLDDHSYVHQLTYNMLPGNGLVIDENGLASIEIDKHTLQQSGNGLFVNTYNLNTAYSYFQKGLIVGDNINYRDYLSKFKESGFTETKDGIVSLNHGFVHEILDIKNIEDKINAEIENINDLLVRMFKSRKYYIGDILYLDTNTLELVDEHNANAIPYMICVISSDTTDDKLPRFIKIEEKNYYYPQSSFTSELENIEDLSYTYYLNTYTWVPIYEVPWSQIKPNSNIIYGSYGFIALDREDWNENFQNPFNYSEHYYCNAKEKLTNWYLDASYVSYNNPAMEDWLVQAGGFYTFNISKDIIKNVDNFYDLTDDICVVYNNIIKHYKVEFKYDKNNNRYISKSNSPAIGGTNGIYVMSENSIAMNINWSNILKNPYIKKEGSNEYKLNSAFIPYREVYNYKTDKIEKKYINVIESTTNDLETISNNLEDLDLNPDKFDWEWKQDINYNSELSDDEYKTYCNTVTYINLSKLVDKTGIPNIGLKLQYEYKNEDNKNYKIDYEYFVFKSKYYSYKFTSKDQYYLKKNKSIKYYTDSLTYITRLYDLNNNFLNWQSSYNYDLYIPNCYNYNSNMESNKPTISITAYNLNDLSFDGVGLGKYALNHKSFRDYYGNETISYFYMDLGSEKVLGNGLGQNHMVSNTINKELRDYRLATEGPVYFKPDLTYITAQQSDNEYLLHYEIGYIIGNILDYRSTFIDYYLFANKANYTWGKCNTLSPGCIWLYDPYKILNIYDNQNVLISLNIYAANEEIFVNKLFKFKIQYDSTFNSYMLPDWYDANTNEYMLQCEQADISRITFNYAIDFDSYDKHKRIEELDDVPLAPEGTVIYIPPEPEEEEPEPDDSGGGSPAQGECECNPPDKPVEMWIVEDYVEKEDDYVFLHDMAIGIKFKEASWGDAMVNGSRTNLKLGPGGNIYILYFEMQYPQETTEISGKKYVAFTYRNYSDSKGYVLKLCVNETIAVNRYNKSSWSNDTTSIVPTTRNEDLLKFNLEGKSIKEFFVTSQFKFELVGIGIINRSDQTSRYFVEVEDTKYSIDTYYPKDPYQDVKGSINMTERVTVWNAFKYFKRWKENPPFNNFSVWPKTDAGPDSSGTAINPDTDQFNMTLGKLYKTKDSNTSILYIGSKFYTGGNDGAGTTPSDEPEEPVVAPDWINVNGVTYYKEEVLPACPEPTDDYEKDSYDSPEYKITYYAWVKKPGPSYEDLVTNNLDKISNQLQIGFSTIAAAILASGANNNGNNGGTTSLTIGNGTNVIVNDGYVEWICKNGHSNICNGALSDNIGDLISGIPCSTEGCEYDSAGNKNASPSGSTTSSNALKIIGDAIFNSYDEVDANNKTIKLETNITLSNLNFNKNLFNPETISSDIASFTIQLKRTNIVFGLTFNKDGNNYKSENIIFTSAPILKLVEDSENTGKYKIDLTNSTLGELKDLFNLSNLKYEFTSDGEGHYSCKCSGNISINSDINELIIDEFTTTPTNYTLDNTNSKLTFNDSGSTLTIKFNSANQSEPEEVMDFKLYKSSSTEFLDMNTTNTPNTCSIDTNISSTSCKVKISAESSGSTIYYGKLVHPTNIIETTNDEIISIIYISNKKYLEDYDNTNGKIGGLSVTIPASISNYISVEYYQIDTVNPYGNTFEKFEHISNLDLLSPPYYGNFGVLKIKRTEIPLSTDFNNNIDNYNNNPEHITIKPKDTNKECTIDITFIV